MPNRIIRDGIIRSIPVNSLDWAEEVFYRRLLNVVDDFGCFDADPRLLKAACYPMRLDAIREADIALWLGKLASTGLVALYQDTRGSCILHVLNFHQRCRLKHRKYPEPPKEAISLAERKLREMTVARLAHDGHMTAESYSNSDTNTIKAAAPEPALMGGSVLPPQPPTQGQIELWKAVKEDFAAGLDENGSRADFESLDLIGWQGKTVNLAANNGYTARRMRENFTDDILRAFRAKDPSVEKILIADSKPMLPGIRRAKARG